MHDLKPGRPAKKLKSAQTALHLLERANSHKLKSVLSVLEYAYGRKGPRRTEMMKQIFGNLNRVSRYRPTFYAIAKNHFGEKKMQVNKDTLKSRHPLNVAKMQDKHWEEIKHRLPLPVSPAIMNMLEKRAQNGIVSITEGMDGSQAWLVNQWVDRWVKLPPRRQIIRYYRALLEQVTEMRIEKVVASSQDKVCKPDSKRLDVVRKRNFVFRKSPLSGKRPLPLVNSIDIANL
ncbi:hypothetical protein GGF40_001616 [Coemansia sp. RSA 1286]|nr:hypothetical protein GGF40_001616 [Coemansia sp. RSA 1286]